MAFDEAYNEPETSRSGKVAGSRAAGSAALRPCRRCRCRSAHHRRSDVEAVPAGAVPTGVAIALPAGYVALVHPRSGLAVKQGVTVLNAPGTIDAGYRGEIKVPLINLDPERAVTFHPGDRIAQLVIQRYVEAKFIEAQTLPGSDRAERGFGSTGVAS